MNCQLLVNALKLLLSKAQMLVCLGQKLTLAVFTVSALLLISACATIAPDDVVAMDSQLNTQTEDEAPEPEIVDKGLEPPKLDLDAQLLEQLMITNFASYAGDWASASTSAVNAAELSQDFRVARMATVLALRSQSYAEVAQASELWYKLDAEDEDAYNALLIGLVGSGNVDAALQRFDSRLTEIEADPQESQNQANGARSSDQSSIETQSTYLANSPSDILIRQVAGLLVRQQNADSAMQICEEYVRRQPNSAQTMLSMAYVADHFDNQEKSEEWLDQALELRPDWDVAAQMYSNMLAQKEQNEERIAYIRQYINDNPSSVVMRIQYAAELARQEDYQGGLEIMLPVLEDAPENSNAIIYTAALARQLEKNELSETLYEKALKLEPNNPNVLWTLAGFAIADEDYRKAERYYERIDYGDDYFRAQLQIASMRYETRGLSSAVNYLRRLQPRTEGEFIEIALSRHYLLMQEHEYEEAFGYINDSLVYLPENDDLVYARALVAAELKQLEVAERDFRAIIERQPDHANALNALGYTLADQTNRYEEAKVLILKALELRPEEGHILDSLGWVLYRLKDYEGAISYLLQAYEVMPEVEVAAHLGEVYWEDGQQQQAQDIWRQAYEMDANNQVLIKTLERYGQLELYASQSSN